MNIHEYQAKNILKEFGAPVPNGVVILNKNEIENKAKKLNSKNLAIKAQIHAGGRGKAGGIKLVNNYKDLIEESNKLFDKILVTNQTGKQGKKVKRIYLEEISNIKREFYLSCLIDRTSSKIAFISDRDSESMLGLVENRSTKEVYFSDYDGANVRRVTISRALNNNPAWSPNGRSIAYTAWRPYMDVLVSHIYQGRLESPASGNPRAQNWLPAWSSDGSQLAFTSNRDGQPELYISNADGSELRRLTNHPGIDTSPTWSPQGNLLAFVSDRTGSPQVYVVDADGTGLRRLTFESHCDRPTWSPAPYNEIAYSSQTGPGHDIKVLDLATNESRQLTFGLGTNESPSYSPNGRHVAFSSTRGSGTKQIWVIGRDGRGLRRITREGNNEMPSWAP